MSGVLDVLAGAIGVSAPEFGSTAGGSLYSWGANNTNGELALGDTTTHPNPTQIGLLTNWSSTAFCANSGFGIKTDGTLWAWGNNSTGILGLGTGNTTSYSSPVQVGVLTNWKSIYGSSISERVFAIKTDGTLWAWGSGVWGTLGTGNSSDRFFNPSMISSLTNWSKISCGSNHTMSLKTDGTLWSWGLNSYGALGTGNTTAYYSPVQVGALTNWTDVAAGSQHSIGVKSDGTIWAWGYGYFGQLGLNNTGNQYTPTKIGALTNWKSVSCGANLSMAIKTNGTAWAWGNNFDGSLGFSTSYNYYSSPKQIGALTDWSSVSTSLSDCSIGIKTDNSVWKWGKYVSTFPVQTGSGTLWNSVSVGDRNFLAITAPKPTVPDKPTNIVATTGDASATVTFTAPDSGYSPITSYTVTAYTGGVSTGISTSGVTTSIKITGLTNGTAYTFTVKATNAIGTGKESPASGSTLWSYGAGYYGALGLGNTTSYSVPKQVGTLTDWSTVSSGAYESIGIKTDGTLWSWGKNNWGQSGLGNTTVYSSPKQVGALTNWLKVASAYGSVMAIKTDGSLWSWGYNGTGSLGHGNNVNYSSPKQVGALTDWSKIDIWGGFVISTKTDGSLWSWGFNSSGQLGLGNTTNYYSPKQVGALTTWLNIVSGYAHVIATKTNGTLWTWGYNNTKQLGLGNTTNYSSPKQVGALTDWSSIAGGDRHSIATKTDGSLWGWGRNDSGQLGLGTTGNYNDKSFPTQIGALTDWSTVSCGGSASSFATKTDGTLWVFGDNSDGKLGLGDTTLRSSPTQVGSLTTWGSIAPGYFHTLALKRAGSNTVTPEPQTFVDDVFSTYLYTGNGSTQTITNGIDLAGKGGLVWLKSRSSPNWRNCIFDTSRGVLKRLATNNTDAQENIPYSLEQFNSNGFSLNGAYNENEPAKTYASWTFRKAAKFFDVVTYTGTGVARTVAHSLGVAPGMMIVKSTSYPLSWPVYHRSNGAGAEQYLNMTDAVSYGGKFPSAPTSSSFYISENDYVNKLGETYVAYLFAHDTSSTGIIQCGSFNNNPSGISSPINLGWEPQFLLMKNASSAEDWYLIDTMRRFTVNGTINYLNPNTSSAENAAASSVALNSTGFQTFGLFAANSNIIYMAIRMPNKPPTTGTQVYNGIARTGTGAAATVTGVGFAPDAVLNDVRYAVGGNYAMFRDKLRGGNMQVAAGAAASEQNWSDTITAFLNDGINLGVDASTESINKNSLNYINWFLKRAPGFFDVVCYTGSGGAANITHGLGVTPELVMVKSRSQVDSWCITSKTLSPSGQTLRLNGTEAWTSGFTLSDSSTVFSVNVSGIGSTNAGGQTYVAYLFATLAGISKVGSYTGNGGSQAINCGFTSGARFVLIKRTDNVGSWYVWDTARSINPGNEPHLSLNTSDGEVTTDDSMDYDTNGFVVNQVADTNVNVTSATYIYLAIA